MKAYIASDRNGDSPVSTVVFAETAGKARAYVAGSDCFEDYTFTEIRVNRCKALDGFYRGKPEMDWLDMDDRVAMVKHAGFQCSYEVYKPKCDERAAYEFCDRGKGAEE